MSNPAPQPLRRAAGKINIGLSALAALLGVLYGLAPAAVTAATRTSVGDILVFVLIWGYGLATPVLTLIAMGDTRGESRTGLARTNMGLGLAWLVVLLASLTVGM